MHRWVKANNDLWFEEFDSTLPQNSSYPEQRKQELKLKRQEYELIQKIPGAPQGVSSDCGFTRYSLLSDIWVVILYCILYTDVCI